MDQLTYDLQVPEEPIEIEESHGVIIAEIQSDILNAWRNASHDYESVNSTISRNSDVYSDLTIFDFTEWLEDYFEDRDSATNALNGLSLEVDYQEAEYLATEYIRFLVSS